MPIGALSAWALKMHAINTQFHMCSHKLILLNVHTKDIREIWLRALDSGISTSLGIMCVNETKERTLTYTLPQRHTHTHTHKHTHTHTHIHTHTHVHTFSEAHLHKQIRTHKHTYFLLCIRSALQASLQKNTHKKERLEGEVEQCSLKLGRAEQLIGVCTCVCTCVRGCVP